MCTYQYLKVSGSLKKITLPLCHIDTGHINDCGVYKLRIVRDKASFGLTVFY